MKRETREGGSRELAARGAGTMKWRERCVRVCKGIRNSFGANYTQIIVNFLKIYFCQKTEEVSTVVWGRLSSRGKKCELRTLNPRSFRKGCVKFAFRRFLFRRWEGGFVRKLPKDIGEGLLIRIVPTTTALPRSPKDTRTSQQRAPTSAFPHPSQQPPLPLPSPLPRRRRRWGVRRKCESNNNANNATASQRKRSNEKNKPKENPL